MSDIIRLPYGTKYFNQRRADCSFVWVNNYQLIINGLDRHRLPSYQRLSLLPANQRKRCAESSPVPRRAHYRRIIRHGRASPATLRLDAFFPWLGRSLSLFSSPTGLDSAWFSQHRVPGYSTTATLPFIPYWAHPQPILIQPRPRPHYYDYGAGLRLQIPWIQVLKKVF